MIIEVNVTKHAINKGRKMIAAEKGKFFPNHTEICPLWYALKNLGFKEHQVGKKHIESGLDLMARDIKLPAKAQKFIEAVDKGEKVEPFTFKISVNKAQAKAFGLKAA